MLIDVFRLKDLFKVYRYDVFYLTLQIIPASFSAFDIISGIIFVLKVIIHIICPWTAIRVPFHAAKCKQKCADNSLLIFCITVFFFQVTYFIFTDQTLLHIAVFFQSHPEFYLLIGRIPEARILHMFLFIGNEIALRFFPVFLPDILHVIIIFFFRFFINTNIDFNFSIFTIYEKCIFKNIFSF